MLRLNAACTANDIAEVRRWSAWLIACRECAEARAEEMNWTFPRRARRWPVRGTSRSIRGFFVRNPTIAQRGASDQRETITLPNMNRRSRLSGYERKSRE